MNSKKRLENTDDDNEDIRIGKDEMNLIEYPWAAFGKRTGRTPVVEHEWETKHPITGKLLKASWKVAANPLLGLPTAADLRVYLVMMELTREQGWPQVVSFTRHDLIKRLRWPHNQKHYDMLFDAFERLRGTTMSARNTFWDKGANSYRNATFGILDSAEVVAEKGGRRPKLAPGVDGTIQAPRSMSGQAIGSYFKWNDIIYKSFQDGYLRTFDLNFALSLESDVALALYRYLGKKAFQGRSTFSIELELLFNRHLGLAPAAYPSQMKQRLAPAHAELIERRFLEKVEYGALRSRVGEKVTYTFKRERKALLRGEGKRTEREHVSEVARNVSHDGDVDELAVRVPGVPSPVSAPTLATTQSTPEPEADELAPSELVQRMMELGVSATVAHGLLESFSPEALRLQLDCLDDRNPKDAAAVLVKAVREGWEPPQAYLSRQKAAARAGKAKEAAEAKKCLKAAARAQEQEAMAAQEQEALMLEHVWHGLDASAQEQVEVQVRALLEGNEFLRARLQAGKLTPTSPDWVQTRYTVLRQSLDEVGD